MNPKVHQKLRIEIRGLNTFRDDLVRKYLGGEKLLSFFRSHKQIRWSTFVATGLTIHPPNTIHVLIHYEYMISQDIRHSLESLLENLLGDLCRKQKSDAQILIDYVPTSR